MVYDAWKYRGNINNSSPSSSSSIGKVTIIYMPGMNLDFSDLRFSANGQSLAYNRIVYTAGEYADFVVTIPAGVTRVYYHYGNGQAVLSETEYTEFTMMDDLETGTASSYWDIKSTYGTVGIQTDVKYGAYSIGITQVGEGAGESTYDQDHTLVKYPLVLLPVGTVFSYWFRAQRWKSTTYPGHFGGIGLGSIRELYDLPEDGIWREYSVNVNRTATSTWSVEVKENGIQVYSGTVTATFSTYFTIGLQTRHNGVSDNSIYLRLDNIWLWVGATPTPLSVINHYPTPRVSAEILNFIDIDTSLRLSAGYRLRDQPLSASSTLQLSGEGEIYPVLLGDATLTLQASEPTFLERRVLASYPVSSVDVSRSATDVLWQLQTEFIGSAVPAEFTTVHHVMRDALGTNQHMFSGVIVDSNTTLSYIENKTKVTAYDVGWYLAAQYLPDDARTIKLAGSRTTWASWISYLIQGTGLTAYRIASSSAPAKEFQYNSKTTKRKAIDDISQYCGFIFEVKWRNTGTEDIPVWTPCAYWVDQDDIDSETVGLDIPAPLTLTWPDPHLQNLPRISANPDEKINRVRVRGTNGTGTWYTKVLETAAVTAGSDMAREYLEEDPALTSQALVDTRAAALFDYFENPVYSVTAKFVKRYDLKLYQKIKFGTGFPADLVALTDGSKGCLWLRILEIKYHTGPTDESVEIKAVTDQALAILLDRLASTNPTAVSETTTIVNQVITNSTVLPEIGTVTAVAEDNKSATIQTESGKTITARII